MAKMQKMPSGTWEVFDLGEHEKDHLMADDHILVLRCQGCGRLTAVEV